MAFEQINRVGELQRAEREAKRFGNALSKAAFNGWNPSAASVAALERVVARWERGYQAQRVEAQYIRAALDVLATGGGFDDLPF